MVQRVAQPVPFGDAPQPAYVTRQTPVPAVASSLGGSRSALAPPVPYNPSFPR